MAVSKKLFFYIYDIQLILFLSLLFLCICCYVNFLWRKRNMFIKSWNHPGPFNFPIFGAAYHFMARTEYIYGRMCALQQKYQEGFKMWFGNRLIYFLHKPEEIEKILGSTKLVRKDALYKFAADAIGEGILTAQPDKWKKHRRIIMPSFNQKVLDSFVEIFAEQSLVLTDILTENYGKKLDIHKLLSRCTLDIVCETVMGFQLDIQKTNHHYVDPLDRSMALVFLRTFQLWNHIDFIWKFLGYDRELQTTLKTSMDLIDKAMKQKFEARETEKQRKSSCASIEEGPHERLAILDYIMENGEFSSNELRDEVTVFLLAATDTTAVALSFVFAVIGMFPDVQQKVLEEVTEVLGNDRMPNYKDLQHMVYTERVIKETLRLFPPGCFFLRHITEDVDMGDFVIPKDATAYFGLVFIHRNPKYWRDPLKFDPDRFLPEEVAKRQPCTYIPFSYGPRNCIGAKYGMMSMKVIISTVIRKFKFHCEYKKIEDINLKANVLLRFQDDPKITLIPREN